LITFARSITALITVIAATATGAQSCGAGSAGSSSGSRLLGACWIDTRGIKQEGPLVTDVIIAKCDGDPTHAPKSHTLEAWLEYKPNGVGHGWKIYESRLKPGIPDASGISLTISEPCRTGDWMPYWKAYGVDSTGKWFGPDEPDHDFFPTPVECQ
jgi:hypothetical protein